ncbi:MAG: hypothetical protein RR315_07490 [Oscillospiraceae bacterium]
MRNSIISLVVLFSIILYTLFSFLYINTFITDFQSSIDPIHLTHTENFAHIKVARELFNDKKNTLLLMISKEHINKISDSLISLEVAIKFEDSLGVEEHKNLLLDTLEDINMHNSTIN